MDTYVKIAGIVRESIVDGPGLRMVVFAQGCRHNCPGCHNPQSHSFDSGTLMTVAAILEQVKRNPLLDGITFSGGDPFEQAGVFAILAREAKNLGLDIVTYTGYTYEYIRDNSSRCDGWDALLDQTDILIDGRYDEAKRNLLLRYRGSENQRMIDIKRTKAENRVVIMD